MHMFFMYFVSNAIFLREQELSNYLQQKDYVSAVGVAINLDQPVRVHTILSGTHTVWSHVHVYMLCKTIKTQVLYMT